MYNSIQAYLCLKYLCTMVYYVLAIMYPNNQKVDERNMCEILSGVFLSLPLSQTHTHTNTEKIFNVVING